LIADGVDLGGEDLSPRHWHTPIAPPDLARQPGISAHPVDRAWARYPFQRYRSNVRCCMAKPLACWFGRHTWVTRTYEGDTYKVCAVCGKPPRVSGAKQKWTGIDPRDTHGMR
jgi:hypothetical protein